jgi:superfamily II DNA or RNA helicase
MSVAIPVSEITKENITRIEKALLIAKDKPSPKFQFTPPKTAFYHKNGNSLNVPFSWGSSYFGRNYLPQCSPRTFSFVGTLRDEQKILEEEAMNHLTEHNTCLMAVYPGGGKTITALSIISKLKKSVLIIVNKIVLIEQWRDSIRKFLGMEPFVIGGVKCNIMENSIYIINAINIPKHDFFSMNIGCVIVDECHLILTTVFSKGLFHICPQYLIGLSATPYRNDGYDALFDIYFGVHRIHRSLYRSHEVQCVFSQLKIEHQTDKFGNINWNSVIEQQSLSKERQMMIVEYCLQHPKRNILILCKRIQQIVDLYNMLLERQQSVAVFKENATSFDTNCRILVSSYQKVGTGFSFDKLDMLILGTDTEEYFLQYLGRVFRTVDGTPLIVDIVDDHPVLLKHYRTRQRIYKECGGKVLKKKITR